MALIDPYPWEIDPPIDERKRKEEEKEKRRNKFVDEFLKMTEQEKAELLFEMKEEINRIKEKDRTSVFGSDFI